jgi:hypothetical protein
MQRVIDQQTIAVTWDEDPRNPYGQLVFERVYDQIRAEQAAKAEPLLAPVSAPPLEEDRVPPIQAAVHRRSSGGAFRIRDDRQSRLRGGIVRGSKGISSALGRGDQP